MILKNYALGQWTAGEGKGQSLFNAITGDKIAETSSNGLDFGEMMKYARSFGGPTLRKMTFHERGRMLKALALHLLSIKNKFYGSSAQSGATQLDSWIDIEGGIGNLFTYASLRKQFPDETYYVDGEHAPLSKGGSFIGQHICVPKQGVAIHINAFNFPIWGMLEKIAVNLLAGVPAIVKPATVTCYVTELMVKEIVDSKILPEGSLQLICGSARGILESVTSQDVVTFTGSASTGRKLKSHKNILNESVPFNMEADSLNCCVLGEDVNPGSIEFDLFIKELQREMTVKAGQKCTAIRRVIVPSNKIEDVQIALGKRLAKTTIGDPSNEGVRMGSLAGLEQREEVKDKILQLSKSQEIIFGDLSNFEVVGADKEKGAFLPPILFLNNDPFNKIDCHNLEAFGPVSTLMPYKGIDEAIELANMGKGSLVCSIVTADDAIAKEFVMGAAANHGRILILNADCAKESTG
ncbi:MAG: phenylacetic acid degradation bifunctional protein PaaZ, partial [Flavobacteriales bacterium]|nr:phenylacetic acid degradation bifunctional protein PaaZ [Flavobacteriales bacterium]